MKLILFNLLRNKGIIKASLHLGQLGLGHCSGYLFLWTKPPPKQPQSFSLLTVMQLGLSLSLFDMESTRQFKQGFRTRFKDDSSHGPQVGTDGWLEFTWGCQLGFLGPFPWTSLLGCLGFLNSMAAGFPEQYSKRWEIEDASISRHGSGNWLAVSCAKFYWSQNPLRFTGREYNPHPLVEGVSSNLSSYSLQ